jgi:hypothetical protein
VKGIEPSSSAWKAVAQAESGSRAIGSGSPRGSGLWLRAIRTLTQRAHGEEKSSLRSRTPSREDVRDRPPRCSQRQNRLKKRFNLASQTVFVSKSLIGLALGEMRTPDPQIRSWRCRRRTECRGRHAPSVASVCYTLRKLTTYVPTSCTEWRLEPPAVQIAYTEKVPRLNGSFSLGSWRADLEIDCDAGT